ncbi:MAG TPA: isocitrate/isopropylmalate family dehydrogenase, partial [Vicinamibacterales bacterium]|nr:isocitrate/isopropylmalate family dehydrogenase [Vicinamibacterales bacterium]
MTHRITLIPGDGIGPEVTDAVLRILAGAGVSIEWDRHEAGVLSPDKQHPLPAALLESIRCNKVALKGPVTTPIGEGFTSVNVGLRKALDLYANLRPVANIPGIQARFTNVDIVIVRENTEDLYAGLEHQIVPGVVESLKIITAAASTRIGRFAFEYARANGRARVTAVHKANIMKMSDGLFLESVRTVAKEYAEIAYDERIIDAACMQLVLHPERFDVMVLPNLYGDIMSDLCAGLVGGLGVVGAANLGADCAVFEAVHG